MCNKCETPATPATPATPLLTYWSERTGAPYRTQVTREFIKEQYQQENCQYWSHERPRWVKEEHPENQQRGHELAKKKATAHKLASREATTLMDAQVISCYLKLLGELNGRLSFKLEPSYEATILKLRDGTWEELDIMNKLHPYVNNQGSSRDSYNSSQQAFVLMNRLHRVHISTEDINQIAYYPTLKHMREGREVRTRLGRYLTKYQQALNLSEGDIKNIAEKHSSNMRARGGWGVDFIAHNDEAGWLRVYKSPDVHSCMQNEEAVRVYAHEKSVLRLAHVKAGDKIIARCIVREGDDAKGWLRVYPDPNGYAEGRYLLDYLKTNGYDRQTNLNGALLQHLETNSGIVCPYLDSGNNGDQSVSVVYGDGKSYLEAGGGELTATNTNGYVEDNQRECDICGDNVDDDDITHIDHDNHSVCECCRDNNYTYAYGRRYEDYFPEDECVEVNGSWYWVDTIEDHGFGYCEHTSEYHDNGDLVHTYDGVYHQDYVVCVDRVNRVNDNNYEWVYQANVHTLSDGTTCHENDADMYQAEIDAEASVEA